MQYLGKIAITEEPGAHHRSLKLLSLLPMSWSASAEIRLFKGTCAPCKGLCSMRNVARALHEPGFSVQVRVLSPPTGLFPMLHPHITSVLITHLQHGRVRTRLLRLTLPFPGNSQHHFPNQLINSWLFFQLRKWLSGSNSPILSNIPSRCISLMRLCHCIRNGGADKLQDSEQKDHPCTMGAMGTIPALLVGGSLLMFYPLFVKWHGIPARQMLSIVSPQK